ncbi:MAG: hydroxymethylbilane synthase [Planctomycetes bacterium GWF2_41_51]|nr:MAG: hydroxymethylbilane synthase [Planctomycetes bacterium GWF2_41_51]HBG26827.1 hydroxymethylbilane synthase [Phycisphaerales bacterium]
MEIIRIATRSSSLALIQTQIVVEAISKKYSKADFEIVEIKSQGDIDKKKPLWKSSEMGLFTAAIENALRENRADIAVHSYKDLPIEAAKSFVIGAVLDRRFVHDCLICKNKINSPANLPQGAKIGTSSLRRKAQLLHLRPDLKCEPIRGNVHTRISQVEKGLYDATVLAYAGIERLELTNKISINFDATEFLPSPAQGALAVEARANDHEILKMLAGIDDKISRISSDTERLVLHKIKAGCHAPAGVYAKINGSEITIYAFVADENGQKFINRKMQGHLASAHKLAEDMAEELLKSGAAELLKNG